MTEEGYIKYKRSHPKLEPVIFSTKELNCLPGESWSHQIRQETLEQFNQRLTQIATRMQITQGRKMRTDGTVVATNIHFPSDNSLLVDGVKVISRLLSQAKEILLRDSKNINLSIFSRVNASKII